VRRFGSGRLGAATRGRQPRLAVIDYASVDGRRRLILVRRDNVEHLLMIGGPTDVVVEPNIVRAVAAPRDAPGARPPASIETLPRAIPLPDNGANGSSWPLQPEPIAGARPSPRLEPLPDEPPSRPLHSAEPRPQRDTLAALADELGSARPAPSRRSSIFTRPQPTEPRAETKTERSEPRLEPHSESPAQAAPTITPPPSPAPEAKDADQSLADMAQRLEAALRKPNTSSEPRRPAGPPRPPQAGEAAHPADTPPRAQRSSEPKPARPEAKPKESKAALYDSLEQEMASLLGRPNKT
jgi:flagellar protein FliO/FliZ